MKFSASAVSVPVVARAKSNATIANYNEPIYITKFEPKVRLTLNNHQTFYSDRTYPSLREAERAASRLNRKLSQTQED